LDEVGHWYRMVNGSRVRECNFNQILTQAIQNEGWSETFDEDTSPITFQKIKSIFDKNGYIKLQY